MSNTVIEQAAQKHRESISEEELIKLTEVPKIKLSDAIRGGSKSTEQAYGWGNMTETACAMTAAAIHLKALGYL